MTARSGPAVARASLSARQAEQAGLLTSGTYGPTGSGSSSSVGLVTLLANKLQAKTASAGSILYRLTWKERVTPLGRPICALRASAWSGKSPKVANGYAGPFTIALIPSFDPCFAILPIGLAREISTRAETIFASDSILSGWPTPMAGTPAQNGNNPAGNTDSSRATVALLSGWPTPCQQDGPNGGPAQGADRLPGCAPLVGWTTTTTRDHKDTPGMTALRDGKDRADQLPRQAYLSGWPTPVTVPDSEASHGQLSGDYRRKLGEMFPANQPMRLSADGTLKTGCSAGMESGGQLDPAHSRWLMALPPEWDDCAPLVTRSTRKQRPVSAKP